VPDPKNGEAPAAGRRQGLPKINQRAPQRVRRRWPTVQIAASAERLAGWPEVQAEFLEQQSLARDTIIRGWAIRKQAWELYHAALEGEFGEPEFDGDPDFDLSLYA